MTATGRRQPAAALEPGRGVIAGACWLPVVWLQIRMAAMVAIFWLMVSKPRLTI